MNTHYMPGQAWQFISHYCMLSDMHPHTPVHLPTLNPLTSGSSLSQTLHDNHIPVSMRVMMLHCMQRCQHACHDAALHAAST
jgi:hypothetical protein